MKRFSLLFLSILLFAVPALADTLFVNQINTYYDLAGYGTIGIGPVSGNLNGGSLIGLVCDDFTGTTHVPTQFPVFVGSINNLSQTKFGINDSQQYHEAAWLLGQFATNKQYEDIVGIQFAIWNLFYPQAPNPGSTDIWLGRAQGALQNNFPNFDFSNFQIFTPTGGSNQEFLTMTSPVPEPATLILLGSGLVGLFGLRRFKK